MREVKRGKNRIEKNSHSINNKGKNIISIYHTVFSFQIKWVFTILLIIFFKNIQASDKTDTLSYAKTLLESQEYKKAEKLLSALTTAHPDDLNILWLYGQSAYEAKHYKLFESVYSNALQKFPSNFYLKLDYAIKLVDVGEIDKALPILERYKQYEAASADLKKTYSKIPYYNEHGEKDTLAYVKRLMNQYEFKKAVQVAKVLYHAHLGDLNSAWLYGQNAYYAKHYSVFNTIYLQTIKKFPANYFLKLDYANKLLQLGDANKAIVILNSYKIYDSTSTDFKSAYKLARFMKGIITNDTLEYAHYLVNTWQYKKAAKVLATLHHSHQDDFGIQWLYAETAYETKHHKTFYDEFNEAMDKYPSNYFLKMDYATKLVENGDIDKAMPLLKKFEAFDSTNSDLKLAYARIQYWQGDYNAALKTLNNKKVENEKQNETRQLKNEIELAKSPWIKINCNYQSDDQPLKSITPLIEAGTFIHPLLSPYINVAAPLFYQSSSSSKSAELITIGDKMNFGKAGLLINLNGGFVQLPGSTSSWTGNIEITKTSFKYLKISAQASHQPYLTTLSSLGTEVMPYHYSVTAGWSNRNSWNGKLIGSMDMYNADDNYITNYSGWIFAPPLKLSAFQFRIGYAYGYSTAKENRLTSKATLTDDILNFNPDNSGITGIYNPYFTPYKQSVHSALLNIEYNPNKHFSIGLNANIGFMGTTENPYLYLDKKSDNTLFVNRDYEKVNFYPDEISVFVLYHLTNKTSLKANYTFLRNNFYTSNTAGIILNVSFGNGRKKK